MKKILIVAILAAVLSIAHSGNVRADVQYANGVYNDCMSITTTNGMKRKTVRLNGRKVRAKFDTRVTKNKKDDRIISVQKRGK